MDQWKVTVTNDIGDNYIYTGVFETITAYLAGWATNQEAIKHIIIDRMWEGLKSVV